MTLTRSILVIALLGLAACGSDPQRPPPNNDPRPDARIALDAGAATDARAADALAFPDAVTQPDAEPPPDAMSPEDTGTAMDSGAGMDAGAPVDSGAMDVGAPADMGFALDAAANPDASASDAMASPDAGMRPTMPVNLTLLSISDWHAQLDPLAAPTGTIAVGGAAVLSAYFARERQTNPYTLAFTAGDAYGASPPLSSFFDEEPAVRAMNMMGIHADTFGNHNFDRGVAHLQRMIDLADFPYVSSNLDQLQANLQGVESPYHLIPVGGLLVGVIGITNPDAATLTFPGRMGTLTVADPVTRAMTAQNAARAAGADVLVALVHMGQTTRTGTAAGPLLDFARAVTGFHVIFGDHTDIEVNTIINDQLVIENLSKGRTYARVELTIDPMNGATLARAASIVLPYVNRVTPDPAIVAMLQPFRMQLRAQLDTPLATTTALFPRGSNVERLGEVAIGNFVTDAMRARYGVDLAVVNGGGLRAPLPSSYAPADTNLRRTAPGYAMGPPFDLVVGDAFAVLPFGNSAVTRTVTGAQLWEILEHGISALPGANGRFPQVSGLRFTYSATAAIGSKLRSVVRHDGTPIRPDTTSYTFATTDFLNAGGDGYSMLADGMGTVRDVDAVVLRDALMMAGTVTPTVTGRIRPDRCGVARAPRLGDLLINEIHADPAIGAAGDANRDGTRDDGDEFVEIANVSGDNLYLAGVTISEPGTGIRHVFADRLMRCGEVLVVFGGGNANAPGWPRGWIPSSRGGTLSLNNSGDEVRLGSSMSSLTDLGVTTYGSIAGNDQSIVRQPELTTGAFVTHRTALGGAGAAYSPGTRADGSAF